jgi:uncharacterized protein (TIGR04141 family)
MASGIGRVTSCHHSSPTSSSISSMDSRGRTDENATTRGERIADFGIERVGAIVTKISGTVSKIPLTYLSSGTRRTVRVVSSDSSIKLPIASTPDELLSDLHAIEDVCARPDPIPELGFIDRIRALRGKTEIVTTLEAKLEELLADPDSPRLAIGVPSECLDDYPTTETFQISKSTRTVHVQDLELSDLLHYVHERPAGSRLSALKDVRVQMFSDVACDVPVSGRISGHRWLTAEVTHSGGRYFYSQGRWYEIGVEYLASIEEELNELFSRAASVALPPWPRHFVGKDAEARYNEMAAEQDGYTLFDKKTQSDHGRSDRAAEGFRRCFSPQLARWNPHAVRDHQGPRCELLARLVCGLCSPCRVHVYTSGTCRSRAATSRCERSE